jgi:hypothetical protein
MALAPVGTQALFEPLFKMGPKVKQCVREGSHAKNKKMK